VHVGVGWWQVFENLVDLQKELSLSVQELMKLQKTYKEEEHITHDARIKAADADDKSVLRFPAVATAYGASFSE